MNKPIENENFENFKRGFHKGREEAFAEVEYEKRLLKVKPFSFKVRKIWQYAVSLFN